MCACIQTEYNAAEMPVRGLEVRLWWRICSRLRNLQLQVPQEITCHLQLRLWQVNP